MRIEQHYKFAALQLWPDDEVGEPRAPQAAPTACATHIKTWKLSPTLSKALEHKDSMGNGSVIRPGDVQRMSVGTGVRHSEYNLSKPEGVRFLQIWIQLDVRGLEPSYEQENFNEERLGNLRLVAIARWTT